MNSLEVYLDHWSQTRDQAIEAMDYLQDRGVISDNAIEPKDVAELDARRAVEVLRSRSKLVTTKTT